MRIVFLFDDRRVECHLEAPPRRGEKVSLRELEDLTDHGRAVVADVIWDVDVGCVDVHLAPEETE